MTPQCTLGQMYIMGDGVQIPVFVVLVRHETDQVKCASRLRLYVGGAGPAPNKNTHHI